MTELLRQAKLKEKIEAAGGRLDLGQPALRAVSDIFSL